jgi:hypothetical protein
MRSSGLNAPYRGRVRMAYFEALADTAKRLHLNEATDLAYMLRETCRQDANPIDLARVCLDNLWPSDARIQEIEGMFAALFRPRVNGPGTRPDRRILEWDVPAGGTAAKGLAVQFVLHVYIESHDVGWRAGVVGCPTRAGRLRGLQDARRECAQSREITASETEDLTCDRRPDPVQFGKVSCGGAGFQPLSRSRCRLSSHFPAVIRHCRYRHKFVRLLIN